MKKILSNKKFKTALIITVFIILFVILFILLAMRNSIPDNPAKTVGNTAGNLNNSGLFCEADGMVYFANAYDGGSLYCMTVNEEKIKKLNHSEVCNILVGGDYLYFYQVGVSEDAGIGNIRSPLAFNRCKTNGTDIVTIARDIVIKGQLVDNYLYLMTANDDGPLFYKIKTDKSDRVELATYEINPVSVQDGIIYYNGTQIDHYLYSLNTSNDVAQTVWESNIWYPIVDGNYVYYLDVEQDYRLCRYSLSEDVVEVLTHDRVDCFNVGYGYIYYQKNSTTAPQLICMCTDGTDARMVINGNYTDINLTSRYVYFKEFGKEDSLYHSPLGTNYAESFMGAIEAANET